MIVSMLGCSLITIQTQRGPNMVSSKKKRLTSAAVIYLGAKVTNTNGIATHIIHIKGIIQTSIFLSLNWSMINSGDVTRTIKAIIVTINLPNIADGTKLIFFADLIITAPTANPVAQTNPKKFPKRPPLSKAS